MTEELQTQNTVPREEVVDTQVGDSVQTNSFSKKDWQEVFVKAGINNYSIRWKWAFRYLIVCKK